MKLWLSALCNVSLDRVTTISMSTLYLHAMTIHQPVLLKQSYGLVVGLWLSFDEEQTIFFAGFLEESPNTHGIYKGVVGSIGD